MDTKRRRKQELIERKDYLPTIGVIGGLWVAVASFIFLVDPSVVGAVPLFFIVLFVAITFTASILFGNTHRGLSVAVLAIGYLGLRVIGLDTILNTLLLVAALLAFEVYFSRKI